MLQKLVQNIGMFLEQKGCALKVFGSAFYQGRCYQQRSPNGALSYHCDQARIKTVERVKCLDGTFFISINFAIPLCCDQFSVAR